MYVKKTRVRKKKRIQEQDRIAREGGQKARVWEAARRRAQRAFYSVSVLPFVQGRTTDAECGANELPQEAAMLEHRLLYQLSYYRPARCSSV